MTKSLQREIIDLIGEPATVALAEEFGGVRLYIPPSVDSDHAIANAIGAVAAQALGARYSPDYIRVPLARELRAKHYRAAGLSNAQIARKLGLTETGVDKMLRRLASRI